MCVCVCCVHVHTHVQVEERVEKHINLKQGLGLFH